MEDFSNSEPKGGLILLKEHLKKLFCNVETKGRTLQMRRRVDATC